MIRVRNVDEGLCQRKETGGVRGRLARFLEICSRRGEGDSLALAGLPGGIVVEEEIHLLALLELVLGLVVEVVLAVLDTAAFSGEIPHLAAGPAVHHTHLTRREVDGLRTREMEAGRTRIVFRNPRPQDRHRVTGHTQGAAGQVGRIVRVDGNATVIGRAGRAVEAL